MHPWNDSSGQTDGAVPSYIDSISNLEVASTPASGGHGFYTSSL